jgi:asparagine synthase (glutamine-hydrolysing)
MIEAPSVAGAAEVPCFPTDLFSRLDAALLSASEKLLPPSTTVGVLFSGGLDSSFLAKFLSRVWPVRLETIGVSDSPDFHAAREGADLLRLPWDFHEVGLKDIRDVRQRFRSRLEGLSEPRRSVAISFALALDKASGHCLVCGQGADELFLGYAHYRGHSTSERRILQLDDLNRLRRDDWPLTQQLAIACRRKLVAPFLAEAIQDVILPLPESYLVETRNTKPLLRAWARRHGLPEKLVARPKRALQYGTGVARLVKTEDRHSAVSCR